MQVIDEQKGPLSKVHIHTSSVHKYEIIRKMERLPGHKIKEKDEQ